MQTKPKLCVSIHYRDRRHKVEVDDRVGTVSIIVSQDGIIVSAHNEHEEGGKRVYYDKGRASVSANMEFLEQAISQLALHYAAEFRRERGEWETEGEYKTSFAMEQSQHDDARTKLLQVLRGACAVLENRRFS